MVHEKCRGEYYSYKAPDGQLHKDKRLHVPTEKVPWTVSWPEYQPPEFTADFVKEAVWADPDMEDKVFVPKWNTIDGNVSFDNGMLCPTTQFRTWALGHL